MRNEKIKTPLTKPATPISKRSDHVKTIADDGEGHGVATIEQWDSQRAIRIPELAEADVQLVADEEAAAPTGEDDKPNADPL
jgi:hypothetical protein